MSTTEGFDSRLQNSRFLRNYGSLAHAALQHALSSYCSTINELEWVSNLPSSRLGDAFFAYSLTRMNVEDVKALIRAFPLSRGEQPGRIARALDSANTVSIGLEKGNRGIYLPYNVYINMYDLTKPEAYIEIERSGALVVIDHAFPLNIALSELLVSR